METIEKWRHKLPLPHELRGSEVHGIFEQSHGDPFTQITDSYIFGYARGYQAAAKRKKGA